MDAISDKVITEVPEGDSSGESDGQSLLTVILDITPPSWFKIRNQITLKEVCKTLLVFLNAHLSLNNSNKVAFITSTPKGSKILYPNPSDKKLNREGEANFRGSKPADNGSNSHLIKTGMYRQFRVVDEAVLEKIDEIVNELKDDLQSHQKSSLPGALSLALTYSNRMLNLDQSISTTTASAISASTKHGSNDASGSSSIGHSVGLTSMGSRILVVTSNDSDNLQYISIMNSIFAAQKMRVPIDVAKLGFSDSAYLQQASDATNGVYLHIDKPEGLIQTLSSAFFIEPLIRSFVIIPTKSDVNYRANCFITGKAVDIGYVCSVCLCIMSILPENGKCPTCNSTFDANILAQLKKGFSLNGKKKRKVEPNGKESFILSS